MTRLSTNQLISPSVYQSTNQSFIGRPTNQSTHQPSNQPLTLSSLTQKKKKKKRKTNKKKPTNNNNNNNNKQSKYFTSRPAYQSRNEPTILITQSTHQPTNPSSNESIYQPVPLLLSRGRYHGGRRPSSDDSSHSPTVIPPSALDKPMFMKCYHRRRTTR